MNRTLKQADTAPQLHEESINGMQTSSAVKTRQTYQRVVAIIGQVTDNLFRLAHVGERMNQPTITPFPNCREFGNALLDQIEELLPWAVAEQLPRAIDDEGLGA